MITSGEGQWPDKRIGPLDLVSCRDREIVNQGGFHHIAEVEHPGDARRVVWVDQHVAGVEIVVNDLRSENGRALANHLLVAVEDRRRLRPAVGIIDSRQKGPQLVDRVPDHGDVDYEAESAELVLLALVVSLPQFAALAMEHDAGELVPALAAVELDQDTAAIGLVVDEPQQVTSLDESPARQKA